MIIGIDVGTQSLKAAVVTDQLDVVGEGSVGYQPFFPRPGWAEQDPLLWERSLGSAIQQALKVANVSSAEVKAVGVAGQLDGCIAVDAELRPLHPCLIWMDRRAENEVSDIDAIRVQDTAGVVLDATHLAAKVRWLRRHVSRAEAASVYHFPVSYLVARLTGNTVIDHATASTSMVYGIQAQSYDRALLAAFEIEPHKLPRCAAAESIAGQLTATGSTLTGLAEGTPVAVGTGDDFSSALGAGLVAPGTLVNILGTAEVTGTLFSTPVIDSQSLVETHAYPGGGFYVENPGWLSGGALTWFLSTFGLRSFQALDAEASSIEAGALGATFFPALSGAMAPEWIAGARGIFAGLSASHGRSHLARALLEGTTFAMRDVFERVTQLGAEIRTLRIVGGGARSDLWCQMRADCTRTPAELPRHTDTSAIGAALLAGVASGILPSIVEAATLLSRGMRIMEPDLSKGSRYDDAYGRYRELFAAAKPLFVSG